MKNFEEFEFVKCGVNLEKNVRDWFMREAKSMGMSMSSYLAFVLNQHYKSEVKADTVKQMSELLSSPEFKEMSEKNVNGMHELQMMFEDVVKQEQEGDKKQ